MHAHSILFPAFLLTFSDIFLHCPHGVDLFFWRCRSYSSNSVLALDTSFSFCVFVSSTDFLQASIKVWISWCHCSCFFGLAQLVLQICSFAPSSEVRGSWALQMSLCDLVHALFLVEMFLDSSELWFLCPLHISGWIFPRAAFPADVMSLLHRLFPGSAQFSLQRCDPWSFFSISWSAWVLITLVFLSVVSIVVNLLYITGNHQTAGSCLSNRLYSDRQKHYYSNERVLFWNVKHDCFFFASFAPYRTHALLLKSVVHSSALRIKHLL